MDRLTIDDLSTFENILLSNSGFIKSETVLQIIQQLLHTMRENERLHKALWHISVNSMPPGDDWCEVPARVARYAEEALSNKESAQ